MEQKYPEMNIEEFIEGCVKQFCPYCGVGIIPNTRGRKKIFCSDKCRWAYHKRKKRKTPWELEVVIGERVKE